MIKYTNNLYNMIFIAAVELRKENQIKKIKHGSNIERGALHYKSEQSKRFESKI